MMGYSLSASILMVFLVYILIVFLLLTNFFSPSSVSASSVSGKNSNNEKRSSETVQSTQSAAKRRAQAKSGLYINSKFVTEIANEQHMKELVAEKKPMMIVFYASWCGHCRNFVPTYTSIAQTATNKIIELNSFHEPPAYTNITFAGVNCVSFRDMCTKHSIEFYPTVVAMNFPSQKEKTKVQGIKNDILKFLKTNYFTHNELENSSITANIKKSVMESKSIPSAFLPIPSHRAHVGSNTDRLHDAWISYLYFLTNELPSEVTTVKAQRLQALIEIVDQVLPFPATLSTNQVVKGKLIEEVKTLLYKYSRSAYVPRAKLVVAVQSVLSTYQVEIKWRACGVGAIKSNDSDTGHTDPARGYTCGIWMLFHLLSIHASKPLVPATQQHLVPATKVMTMMYDFIEEFFGCHSCKLHFLQYYKLCWYGRCEIQDTDYEKLQLWLFYLHNFVTSRIYLETLPSVHILTGDVVESLIRNKLWPGYTLCPECYQSPVLPLDRNIKDLIIPKKGQTIRKYSVMEEEKVLESLIQPVLANAFNSSQVLYFLHSKAFSV